jgi:hypothetical protein
MLFTYFNNFVFKFTAVETIHLLSSKKKQEAGKA